MKPKFDWRLTCCACPEQYDIYMSGRPVAYFRLRWGYISVKEYDEKGNFGDDIFGMSYGDGFCGELEAKDEKIIKSRVEHEIIKHWLKQSNEAL